MLQGASANVSPGGPSLPTLDCGCVASTTTGTKPTSQEASMCEVASLASGEGRFYEGAPQRTSPSQSHREILNCIVSLTAVAAG